MCASGRRAVGGERHGVRRARDRAGRRWPRRHRARAAPARKARAASSAGDFEGQPDARSTASAESGGLSRPTQPRFQPGPPRRVSNADSSARIQPVTRVIPRARTVAASASRSPDDSVGSPWPRSTRSPRQKRPARSPAPRASVVKRKEAPRRASAAYATGSLAFDAGTKGDDALCANRTRPVRRSIAYAAVRPGESHCPRSDAASSVRSDDVDAVAASGSANATRTATRTARGRTTANRRS